MRYLVRPELAIASRSASFGDLILGFLFFVGMPLLYAGWHFSEERGRAEPLALSNRCLRGYPATRSQSMTPVIIAITTLAIRLSVVSANNSSAIHIPRNS